MIEIPSQLPSQHIEPSMGRRHRAVQWILSGLPHEPIRVEWISATGHRKDLFNGLATDGELTVPHAFGATGGMGWIRVVSGAPSIARLAVPMF